MYDMQAFYQELSLASGNGPEVRSVAPLTLLNRDTLRAVTGARSWWDAWHSPE